MKIVSFFLSLASVVIALLGVSMTVSGNYWAGIPVTVLGFIGFSLIAAYNSDDGE